MALLVVMTLMMTICSTGTDVWYHASTRRPRIVPSQLSLAPQVPTIVRSCADDDDMLMCLHATRTYVPMEYTIIGLGPSLGKYGLYVFPP